MTLSRVATVVGLLLTLPACIPGTYYDPFDDYVIGLRWYDRGDQGERGELKGLRKSPSEFYETAAKYWQPLAERGDCDAQMMYGLLYARGKGRPSDFAKAIEWWTKAANQGQPKARGLLGDLYHQPEANDTFVRCAGTCGLQKDLAKAYLWYSLGLQTAAYEGERKYLAWMLSRVRTELTAEQLSEAETLVSNFRPSPVACKPRSLL